MSPQNRRGPLIPSIFRHAGFVHDREADLPRLSERTTIFRGVHGRHRHGFSWTLAEETALWFGWRPRSSNLPVLYTATIRREDVLGFFDGRSEAEILVDPKTLIGVKRETLEEDDPRFTAIVAEHQRQNDLALAAAVKGHET